MASARPPGYFSLHPDSLAHLFIGSNHDLKIFHKFFTCPGGAKAPHTPQLRPPAAGGGAAPLGPPHWRIRAHLRSIWYIPQ